MPKKITVTAIMRHGPCDGWTKEMIADKIGKGKTLLEISLLRGVTIADKLWCITRFLDDKTSRRFAIWCARQCKTKAKEIGLSIDATEDYYFGGGTKGNMDAAFRAANDASFGADFRAANDAAFRAAFRAAHWADCWATDWATDWATTCKIRQKQIRKLRSMICDLEKE